MTKEEKESRDKGREAVRASKEIPQLTSRLREIVRSGNLDDGAPTMTPSDYRSTLNKLRSALYQTGKTPSEIDAYVSKIIEGATVAKATHSFDSRDEFYAAVFNYKKENKIEHHGILGMKWGIRRYQHPDGTLTALGRRHLNDGKTDKAIEKFRLAKATAIAKGDKKFAEKNIDYMTNDDIQKMNERIRQRNTILGLKKDAEGINAERFKTWLNTASNVVQTGANLTDNGIKLYNSVVKINNAFSSHKLKPINTNGDEGSKPASIFETWENGKLIKKQKQWTDEEGNKRDTTENWKDKEKNPESHENIYDKDGKLSKQTRTYTDDSGNNVRDVHIYTDPQQKGGNKGATKEQIDYSSERAAYDKKQSTASSNSTPSNQQSSSTKQDWSKQWTEYSKKQAEAIQKAEKEENAYTNEALKNIRKQADSYWADQKKKKGGKK